MKKAKMILSAIAVVAVLGGALAVKANQKGGQKYFTTDTPGSCSSSIASGKITTDTGVPQVYYTVTTDANPSCPEANFARVTSE